MDLYVLELNSFLISPFNVLSYFHIGHIIECEAIPHSSLKISTSMRPKPLLISSFPSIAIASLAKLNQKTSFSKNRTLPSEINELLIPFNVEAG